MRFQRANSCNGSGLRVNCLAATILILKKRRASMPSFETVPFGNFLPWQESGTGNRLKVWSPDFSRPGDSG